MRKEISRRHALRQFGLGGVVCPVCLALGAKVGLAESGHGAHWGYEGDVGPEHWGELQPDFKVCELGFEQTPIDLKGAVKAEVAGIQPLFQPMPLTILNNGHTIQANCAPGSKTLIGAEPFELLQFHFHHPSEHLLSGKPFDLELHFVHKSAAGQLAVLGVFIRPGAENAALAPIWAAMPAEAGEPQEIGTTIRPADLLPATRGFFRYQGSLTTPPCSEGVLWTVFKEPIEASDAQIRQFAGLFPVNARTAQPINRRFLLESL
jgi:carbonic anhydrase